MDDVLRDAAWLFLIEAYGQDADGINGPGSEHDMVSRTAARLTPQQREGLLRWFKTAQAGSEAQAEKLLLQELRLEFDPARWQHPDGLPQHGARAMLGYLCEALECAQGPA